MAIFIPSALVSAVSGKVGGVTFVSSGKGKVIKSCGQNVRAFSRLQLARQARLAWAKGQWAGLTAAQQSAWNAAAALVVKTNALGEVVKLTGYQAYIKAQMVRSVVAAPTITAPTVRLVGPMLTCNTSAFFAASNYNVTCNATGASGAQATYVYGATYGMSRAVKKMSNWRYIQTVTSNFGTGENVRVAWIAAFGVAMVAGQRFGIRVINTKDCYWSAETEFYSTVI